MDIYEQTAADLIRQYGVEDALNKAREGLFDKKVIAYVEELVLLEQRNKAIGVDLSKFKTKGGHR